MGEKKIYVYATLAGIFGVVLNYLVIHKVYADILLAYVICSPLLLVENVSLEVSYLIHFLYFFFLVLIYYLLKTKISGKRIVVVYLLLSVIYFSQAF